MKPVILYDAQCKVCNAEIEFYKKNDPNGIFDYKDIMHPSFDVSVYNLTDREVYKYFHVVKDNGEILKGVKAFSYIWEELNLFSFLQKVTKTKLGHGVMVLGYHVFVKVRPLLPRNKDCNYCIDKGA
jgi:predicted DCC family thiol-disulfide oxidoreductase YuxK